MMMRYTVLIVSVILWNRANGNQLVCPADTLNEGWIVEQSSAFKDPLDCCGEKVRSWEFAEDMTEENTETGCLMSKPLASASVTRYIHPMFCKSNNDCGDTTPDGREMECCPEGYCYGKSETGQSLCGAALENEVMEPGVEYEDDAEEEEDPVREFATLCRIRQQTPCLSCDKECPAGSISLPTLYEAAYGLNGRSNRKRRQANTATGGKTGQKIIPMSIAFNPYGQSQPVYQQPYVPQSDDDGPELESEPDDPVIGPMPASPSHPLMVGPSGGNGPRGKRSTKSDAESTAGLDGYV